MFFHRSLSENKSPPITRTLLSILADLNNAVVWMVSSHPISKALSPFTNSLMTIPTALITFGIIITIIIIIIIIIIISLLVNNLHLHQLVVFHWVLSDCKSTLATRTLLTILTDLNKALVGMISVLPLISYSSSPFSKPLGSFQSALATIRICHPHVSQILQLPDKV